jgi:hypothetical protein
MQPCVTRKILPSRSQPPPVPGFQRDAAPGSPVFSFGWSTRSNSFCWFLCCARRLQVRHSHRLETAAGGLGIYKWPPVLVITAGSGASSAARGVGERSPSFVQWVVSGAEQTRSTLPSCIANPRPPQVNMSAAWTVTAPVMVSSAAARNVFMSLLLNKAIYPLPGPLRRSCSVLS